MYSLEVCKVFRHNIRLNKGVDEVVNEMKNYSHSIKEGSHTYFRLSIKTANESLDLTRLITKEFRTNQRIYQIIKSEHIKELLTELTKPSFHSPELELVNTPIYEEALTDAYIGDFYFKDLITPLSHALTYFKIDKPQKHLILEETNFNICSVKTDYEVVGCLIKSSSEQLSLKEVQQIIQSLLVKVSELKPSHRYVTWLLVGESIYIIDY
ncbi:MAG: hypothetical protein N3G48_02945 [Sulfolobales archaeon]|nr:hypothetical protein [Sulfolobales archaeon]